MIGKKIILRSNDAGVLYGTLVKNEADSIILKNARKLYYWSGANTVEDLVTFGVIDPKNCKFTWVIPEMEINSKVQIIPCTKEAIKVIEAVPIWTAKK